MDCSEPLEKSVLLALITLLLKINKLENKQINPTKNSCLNFFIFLPQKNKNIYIIQENICRVISELRLLNSY